MYYGVNFKCQTCFDGIENQNEDDIDCGGVCPPCPSCVDNVMNQDETEPDCGGTVCDPCPSCTDGILTENNVEDPPGSGNWIKVWEDGIDCGGPCPNVCWLGVDEVDPNILFLGQTVPNPAYNLTMLSYQLPEDGIAEIVVRNTLTTEVFRKTVDQKRGIHKMEVDVSSWSAGLYYYSIEFNGERLIQKMVVSKE